MAWPAFTQVDLLRYRGSANEDGAGHRLYRVHAEPIIKNINAGLKAMQVLPVFTTVVVDGEAPLVNARLEHSIVQDIKSVTSKRSTARQALVDIMLEQALGGPRGPAGRETTLSGPLFPGTTLRDLLSFSSACNAFVAAYRVFPFPPFRVLLERVCKAPQVFSSAPETRLGGERVAVGDGGFFDNTGLLGLLHKTSSSAQRDMDVLLITKDDENFGSLKSLGCFKIEVVTGMERKRKRMRRHSPLPAGARGVVAYAKLNVTVLENAYSIEEGRTMTLHVLSVNTKGTMAPFLRRKAVRKGNYRRFMGSVLDSLITQPDEGPSLLERLPPQLYVAIGGGGVVTMCAGAPVLHLLTRFGKTIILGSGVSGGSWAFAFASYVDPRKIVETSHKLFANRIVEMLNAELDQMCDAVRDTVGAQRVELTRALPAFFVASAAYRCDWRRYVHDLFHRLGDEGERAQGDAAGESGAEGVEGNGFLFSEEEVDCIIERVRRASDVERTTSLLKQLEEQTDLRGRDGVLRGALTRILFADGLFLDAESLASLMRQAGDRLVLALFGERPVFGELPPCLLAGQGGEEAGDRRSDGRHAPLCPFVVSWCVMARAWQEYHEQGDG